MSATDNNVVVLSFAQAKQPSFVAARGGAIMKFGDDNLYPDYLQKLYDEGTKHGSLIDGKVTYIIGKGWQVKAGAQDPRAEAWIKQVNRYRESLREVSAKASKDIEIFGGAYLQVIWGNASRQIAEVYHLDYTKVRTNGDNTQFIYREAWKYDYAKRFKTDKVYPAFNPSVPYGSQVLFLKEYRPGMRSYPLPGYIRAINYISAEIEVGKHTYGNASTGFTPSTSITMTNGEPETDEEKKKITKSFERTFTGADGKKFILFFTNGAAEAPIINSLGASDLTKEDFTAVDGLIRDNIFSGHQITTPALFGIATPGSLGQRTELETGYEIFKNTYVNDKQEFLEKAFNTIACYAGITAPLAIIPAEPLGVTFSEATIKEVAPKAWILEKLGIDPTKYPDTTQPADMGAGTNSAIRDLSGRQFQGYERIKRKLKNGDMTEAEAREFMKSAYGLTDEQITTILAAIAADNKAEPQATQLADADDTDDVVAMFAEVGEPAADYTIVKSIPVSRGTEDTETIMLQFVTASPELNALQRGVLDLVSKDKRIDAETIAKILKADPDDVNNALTTLERLRLLKIGEDGGSVVRELTEPLADMLDGKEAKTREFVVKYSYEGPKDSRNRPFCAKMMDLDKIFSRAEIETISRRLGYPVWERRGGFRTNPDTGETTPYCRHKWVAHLVEKKQA